MLFEKLNVRIKEISEKYKQAPEKPLTRKTVQVFSKRNKHEFSKSKSRKWNKKNRRRIGKRRR